MTRRRRLGPDHRDGGGGGGEEWDALVPVAAGELLEWAWLAGELAEWLTSPARVVAADHARRYPLGPTLNQQSWMLQHINERIGALLDGDRGQP